MSRPNWDQIFLDICVVIARRSTCIKYQTASIVVKDTNIISIGYNGVPAGRKHCIEHWLETATSKGLSCADFLATEEFRRLHREWSARCELHAEINALVKCKTDLNDATLYTLFSPCINCAKCIVSSGIKRVVYKFEFKRTFEDSERLFLENHIAFEQVFCAQNLGHFRPKTA